MDQQTVSQQLKTRFGTAILEEIICCNEITLEVEQNSIKDILTYLKTTPEPGYDVLIDLTAVDYLEPKKHTKVLYFLYNPILRTRLCIAFNAQRLSKVPSITDLWEGANWYEREIYDLFGLQFEGHPCLSRILMPDDWEGHPLLRDYALTEEPVQFKHGVQPKVPSQIIPYYKG
ncbi:MAG: NADH-quinone oxidoreductase subunit C [Parachlamydiaceae bacterium]